MGVPKLWTLLEPAKKNVDLSSLEGKKIAVDLSGWICQFLKVPTSCPQSYMYIRNLFFRVCTLLNAGIRPVFVLDGKAPDIKADEVERRSRMQGGDAQPFNSSRPVLQILQSNCCRLLDAMGLPYLKSNGEAECLCASLNSAGIVDGCITEDGDALLYGAKQVYRAYSRENKTYEGFSIDDIMDSTRLCRRSLIAIAVLSGCDYDKSGVDGVGVQNAAKLAEQWRDRGEDPITQLQTWRTDKDLSSLSELMKSPRKKPVHCTNCYHLGNSRSHSSSGCEMCSTDIECTPADSDTFTCTCKWHGDEEKIRNKKTEIRVRDRALANSHFPNTEIIEEYLNTDQDISDLDIKWRVPNLKKIHAALLTCSSSWKMADIVDRIIPVFVHCHLYAVEVIDFDFSSFKPHRILKLKQKDKKECVEVEWNKLGMDTVTTDDYYTVTVEKDLFKRKYEDLVMKFEEDLQAQKQEKKKKATGKKRKSEGQDMMTNFFSVIKKRQEGSEKSVVSLESS